MYPEVKSPEPEFPLRVQEFLDTARRAAGAWSLTEMMSCFSYTRRATEGMFYTGEIDLVRLEERITEITEVFQRQWNAH